jgi:hypothetical protein
MRAALIQGAATLLAGLAVASGLVRGASALARLDRFAIASADGVIAVLDTRTGLVQTFERPGTGRAFAFVGADSRNLALKREAEAQP